MGFWEAQGQFLRLQDGMPSLESQRQTLGRASSPLQLVFSLLLVILLRNSSIYSQQSFKIFIINLQNIVIELVAPCTSVHNQSSPIGIITTVISLLSLCNIIQLQLEKKSISNIILHLVKYLENLSVVGGVPISYSNTLFIY